MEILSVFDWVSLRWNGDGLWGPRPRHHPFPKCGWGAKCSPGQGSWRKQFRGYNSLVVSPTIISASSGSLLPPLDPVRHSNGMSMEDILFVGEEDMAMCIELCEQLSKQNQELPRKISSWVQKWVPFVDEVNNILNRNKSYWVDWWSQRVIFWAW